MPVAVLPKELLLLELPSAVRCEKQEVASVSRPYRIDAHSRYSQTCPDLDALLLLELEFVLLLLPLLP